MGKKENRLVFGIALVLLFIVIGSFVIYRVLDNYNRSYYRFVLSHKVVYCYETFNGPANPVLYVSKPQYIDSLKKYYSEMEHGNLNPIFNFPIYEIPPNQKVYLLSYSKDSTVAKIAFDSTFRSLDGALTGYVYAHLIHSQKPK
jgi:hypothetical protein